MSLFFFHIRIGEDLDEDTIGVDLHDVDAARREALRAIGDMLRDARLTGQALQGDAFEVTDGDGRPVSTVRFDALPHWARAG